MRALLALAALVVAVPAHAQQPGGNPLPPGNGRDIVAVACSQCHGLNAITQLRKGETGWRDHVYDMFLRGAQINPNEVDTVVDYLAVNFGPGVSVPPSAPVTLPNGPGKDLVEAGCGVCHGLDRAVAGKRRAGEWQRIVANMIHMGAPLSAEQGKEAAAYLAAQFGPK